MQLDDESIVGGLTFSDPNYDFLGNSLNYFLKSESNDKPNQGYENTIVSAGIGTAFEQFRNLNASIGSSLTYDDLRTLSSASSTLKKQSGTFNELSANYGLSYDLRNRAFMPTDGSITSFSQSIPVYADKSSITNTFLPFNEPTILPPSPCFFSSLRSKANGIDLLVLLDKEAETTDAKGIPL